MKKELLYFNDLCNKIKKNLITQEDEKPADNSKAEITTDVNITATVDGEEVPVTVTTTEEDVNIDNVEINIDTININIDKLKTKLLDKLTDTKKKLYASRLYSTNVGNKDALKDYGYFLGQKDLIYDIIKDLDELLNSFTNNEE